MLSVHFIWGEDESDDLLLLCSLTDTFYYKDVQYDLIKYRIFNSNLCSYEQFHKYRNGLNCSGTMFNINNSNKIQLISFPSENFFNSEEGNGINIHPLGYLSMQMNKLDGSLISTLFT